MDPFSLVISLIGIAVGGILGNRADHGFCKVVSSVVERFQQGGPPVNHDLQRAVRHAYLQATLVACEACLKALGAAPSLWWRDIKVVFEPSQDIRQLDALHKTLRRELDHLADTGYVPPADELTEQVALLLQPKGVTAQQRVEELRGQLKQSVLAELRQWQGELPDRFVEMIEHGWEEQQADGSQVRLDWFDLMCAFFVHDLKQNQAVERFFTATLLAHIAVEGTPLTVEMLEAQWATWGQAVAVRLDEILRELRRRPLYERYAAWEVADKVNQLVDEVQAAVFVGREDALARLDGLLTEKSSGVLAVTAKAGFGKTALLANWVRARHGNGCFVAYHFFSPRYEVTRSIPNAYRNLLRQLFIYHELADEPLPDDENRLRETLYGLLRERGARAGEPLVILLDALDEAERPFSPPFPMPLPSGVFVIVSARADAGEMPEYLGGWADGAERLHLARLPRAAIADWLRRAGDGELAAFAEDDSFVAQVDEATEGFPLYLHHLAEELAQAARQGQDVRMALAHTPKGFRAYVAQQLERLDQLDLPEQRWKFLALLAVAKGPLRHEEIKALTGLRDRDLRQMRQFWQITRWLRIAQEADTTIYAFVHPLLSATFADVMGDDAPDALQNLMDWCARWREHKSPYALRHCAEHLREARRWDALFALGRDEAYATAQRERLPEEPDLPLKTVQTALLGAAEADTAGAMAEFLLTHARRLMAIMQESPLDALRAGSLKRAWELADLFEIERCVLWYLLLAWELKDASRMEEARATLERLRAKELPRLSGWQGEYAPHLIAYALEISEQAFAALHRQLLDDGDRRSLCNYLAAGGHFAAALETAGEIESKLERVEALAAIAAAQAQARAWEMAQATWAVALETVQKIRGEGDRWKALGAVAVAQAQAGELATAMQTVQRIDEWSTLHRSRPLATIAIAQAQAGQFEAALQTVQGSSLNRCRLCSKVNASSLHPSTFGNRK